MKVKDLIKKLKSMPQDVEVYYCDHDQDDDEINGKVRFVGEMNTEELGSYVVLGS